MNAGDIVEALKKHAPASLRLELEDGSVKAVAVARSGNRWSKAAKVVESLPWMRAELLDKDGRVVAVLLDEREDDEDDEDDDQGGGADVKLARVMVSVMTSTMREFRSVFDSQLKGMTELCAAMTDGMRSMQDSYQTALKVQAAHLVAGDAGTGGDVMEMMKLAAMLKLGGAPPTTTKGG